MDGQAFLSLAGGVLAVVALLAAATAVLFSTRTKATIEGLRGDVMDSDRRITRLDGEVVRLTAENVALRTENETLRSMKDATAAVGRLADALGITDQGRKDEHHDILATIQAGHAEVLRLIDATVHTHSGGAV
jgi:regulator of replication initiation timing